MAFLRKTAFFVGVCFAFLPWLGLFDPFPVSQVFHPSRKFVPSQVFQLSRELPVPRLFRFPTKARFAPRAPRPKYAALVKMPPRVKRPKPVRMVPLVRRAPTVRRTPFVRAVPRGGSFPLRISQVSLPSNRQFLKSCFFISFLGHCLYVGAAQPTCSFSSMDLVSSAFSADCFRVG